VLLKDKMFLLHFLQEHLSGEKHLILQEHLSGEGTSYHSGAFKWRRNILSFR
jgi:hypothetical protein